MKIGIITPIFDYTKNIPQNLTIINIGKALFNGGASITFFTTTADSERTYKKVFKEGSYIYKGMDVLRFNAEKEKKFPEFKLFSKWLTKNLHSRKDERNWYYQSGPISNRLIKKIVSSEDNFDLFIFYGIENLLTYKLSKLIKTKKILIPKTEDNTIEEIKRTDDVVSKFSGLIFFSEHERAKFSELSPSSEKKPYFIFRAGSYFEEFDDIKSTKNIKEKFSIKNPFLLYTGSIDESHMVSKLLKYFLFYLKRNFAEVSLVLSGKIRMPLIAHPNIHYIETENINDTVALKRKSVLSVFPDEKSIFPNEFLNSIYEGKPSLLTERNRSYMEILKESNAGISYFDYFEFEEALNLLLSKRSLRKKLSINAKKYKKEKLSLNKISSDISRFLEKLL